MANIRQLSGQQNVPITWGVDNSTSSTSVTELGSISIDANTFTTGDYISFGAMFDRNTSGLSNVGVRLYVSTGGTLTGAVQVATRVITITQGFFYLSRKMFIANQTGGGSGNSVGTQLLSSTLNLTDDYQSGSLSSLSIDWTKNITFIAAGFVNDPSDAVNFYSLKVFKY